MPDTPKIQILSRQDSIKFLSPFKSKDTHYSITLVPSEPKKIYQQDWFKIAVPLVGSLLIFFLGQMIAYTVRKKTLRSKLNNSKTALETWILMMEESVNDVKKYSEKFKKDIGELKDMNTCPINMNPTLVSSISKLDVHEFQSYSIFNLTGNRTQNEKRAYEIKQMIEIIEILESKKLEGHKFYLDASHKLITEFRSLSRELFTTVVEIGTSYTGKHQYAEYSRATTNITHEYYKLGEQPLMDCREKLVKPLLQLADEQVGDDFVNHPAFRISKLTHLMLNLIERWYGQNNFYVNYFENNAEQISSHYVTLKSEVEKLRKLPLKKIYQIK